MGSPQFQDMPFHELALEPKLPGLSGVEDASSALDEQEDDFTPELSVDFDRDEVVVPVVKRGNFAFDGRASGTDQTIVLATGIDASWWRTASVLVVGHTKNAWLTGGGGPTTGALRVVVDNVAITEDAPDLELVGNRLASTTAIVATSTLPLFQVTTLSGAIAGQLRVSLVFNQGATGAASAQTIALSVYLLGRAR